MTPPVAPTETAEKDKLSSSSVSSVSTRPAGGFHQRKTSLTTACPPTGARINSSSNTEKSSHTRLSWSPSSSHSSATQWLKRLFRLRIVRFLAWAYLILSIAFSTVHLLTSFSTDSSPVAASVTIHDIDKVTTTTSLELSPLNDLTYRLRLSKMFSKSLIQTDHIRPQWFTAAITPTPDRVTLVTVLTMDEWPHLARLAEVYKGPISATLLIPAYTGGGLGSGTIVQHLSRLRRDYETQTMLSQHVDLHIVVRPNRQDAHGDTIHGGYQDGRNLARLFSRTNVIAYMPVTALWMTDFSAAASKYAHYLNQGDVLIVPTLAFPRRKMEDTWPTSKQEAKDWVDQQRMGLADFHWNLNKGPTAVDLWREATEPYQLPKYDYHYSPVYMTTKEGHPWCEERFADEPAACLYSTYLAGSDLWVLPDDFIVRTGQEPENQLTFEEKKMQVKLYKNFRIEQCVFYARQFEQTGQFDSERAKHVQEECEKELGDLRKQKMVAAHH